MTISQTPSHRPLGVLALALTTTVLAPWLHAAETWRVPVAGNTFRSEPAPGGEGLQRSGILAWSEPEEVYSIFFYVDRAATISLLLDATVDVGQSIVMVTVRSEADLEKFEASWQASDPAIRSIGSIDASGPGYLQVDVQGLQRDADTFLKLRNVLLESDTDGLQVYFVSSNQGNMFYWGRRGSSVHLTYEVPSEQPIEYAYSEITVPEGQDPVGSYFMANGFAQGYFGIQVNSPQQRRVLFSVWSPFRTDDPQQIPPDQRVRLLAKGPEVHTGEFGNEGSGGQSYLVFPWRAGQTYRFLTRAMPDGEGSTTFTAWFGEHATDQWRLIASFQRPKTDTHYRRFHSFLENFNPHYGHIPRRGLHHNVWVRDTSGIWHLCVKARMSVDATGLGRHRLDYGAGVEGSNFFMQNGGFRSAVGQPGSVFTCKPTPHQPPHIDLEHLNSWASPSE